MINTKWFSRKFIVWIVWSILSIVCLIKNNLAFSTVIQYYGLVSLIYIGGNLADKFLSGKNEAK